MMKPIRSAPFVSLVFLVTVIFSAHCELIINSPVADWTVVSYGDNYPDPVGDQQTGPSDSDIVGNIDNPAFYSAFDDHGTPSLTDGTLAFRVRVNGHSKTYWENYLWVGLDADLNGDIDLYVSLAKNSKIQLHYPGNNLNISPNTTSIESPEDLYSVDAVDGTNYSFMAADADSAPGLSWDVDSVIDSNKDGTDWFVSFSLSFSDVVSVLAATNIVINEESPMSFLAATSTQGNSMNQDVNGAPKITNVNNEDSWVLLGAAATPLSANGQVPEPVAVSLIGLGGITLLIGKRLQVK